MKQSNASSVANPDIARWNSKYQSAENPELEARGEPELIALSERLHKRGLALDLAAGRGRNTLYLANLGYRVVACDGALNALIGCSKVARERGLDIDCMVCDLETYRFKPKLFDLLIVCRYLNRDLLPCLSSWIRPSGWLFYKTFNKRFLTANPGFNPNYTVERGELNEIFSELDIHASDIERRDLVQDDRLSFILAQRRKTSS